MIRRRLFFMGLAAAFADRAQSSPEQYFQGRRVTMRLDMPGDESGVDVQPRATPAVNDDVIKERVAKYGAALRRGQVASVTLVKAKGNHIEFQLDGGGFTDRQLWGVPGYDSTHWGTSDQERKIRNQMIGTRDKNRRERLEDEYDRVRKRRVQPLRDKYIRERRAQHGSRFNIRFPSERDAARVTAEELTAILRPYIELQ